ncbi:hypothetical protein JKF63_03977 [Porcisia hertigi]|uniref:Uncharacterized protein n=1 Tax=Porcisia hertigi TaxID=2761500 RepID=A0A836IHF6_9TRYP|nr:hypothetical protein JKF63_03977 [Porcisia hertigi]
MSSPPSSARLSSASLARLLSAARRERHPQHAYSAQLQQYLIQWFPCGLWSFIYRTPSRGAQGTATRTSAYHRFSRNPPRVSHGWAAALQLMELARLVDKMAGTFCSKAQLEGGVPSRISAPKPGAVVQATEYILRYGVFPPSGWALTLQILHNWREKQLPAQLPMFPSSLGPPAAAQLLHHISLAPPSQHAWQEALCLYHFCVSEVHAPSINHKPLPSKAGTSSSPPQSTTNTAAHSAFLKALRHMTLTTLLQAEEWERGLHFYYHTLYQRDLPGPITTSYLVQQLGSAGKWAEVLQVYELCVKLLHARKTHRAQQQRISSHREEWESRMWGTTLSIAMAAVQHSPGAPAGTLAAMVRQLQPGLGATRTHSSDVTGTDSFSSTTPLVRLNGHFLSAVQALPSEKDRLAVLGLARCGSLLDTFKLIRGLLSKHKWEEALLLFEEAMHTAPAHPSRADARDGAIRTHHVFTEPIIKQPFGLSRKEIGEARISFLHEATIDSVTAVVAALNRHRNTTGKRGTGAPRKGGTTFCSLTETTVFSTRLVLNDREVECVFSKTLALREEKHGTPSPAVLAARKDFWRYCLELLAFNYHTLSCGDSSSPVCQPPEGANKKNGSSSHSLHRTPTLAALSFLLRHPQLPWHVALGLLQEYGVLETRQGEKAPEVTGAAGRRTVSASVVTHRAKTSSSPTPRSLALAAAVELLHTQGKIQVAEKLALKALDLEMAERGLGPEAVVSLPAALLEVAQYPTLRSLLLERGEERLRVEATTLFHLLKESTRTGSRQGERRDGVDAHGTPCGTGSFPSLTWWADSAAFFHHPSGRALTVVWLLMQRHLYSPMMTTVAAGQEFTTGFLDSLFLCAFPPPKVSDASESPAAPLRSWLVAYPAAVHCEVLRVIKYLTSPSTSSVSSNSSAEAGLCYTGRWILTRRYLASLAAHFSAACTDTGEREGDESFVENGSLQATTDAMAREAYYGATFEAVLSLLDASMPPSSASSDPVSQGMQMDALPGATILDQDGGAPRTSAKRVRHLKQLLERAIVRYRCLPPTHMLLPNQLNRLLPPLPLSSLSSTTARVREGGERGQLDFVKSDVTSSERCEVALHLVRLVLRTLLAARESYSVEPVLLHNLLKLCCRIAEYDQALLALTPGERSTDVDNSAEVSRTGATLVRLQCELCGLQTVRPGTLSLLYHLCAAAQSRASSHGHTVPRQVALEATCYLLEKQTAAAAGGDHRHPMQGGPLSASLPVSPSSSSRPLHKQQRFDLPGSSSAVQRHHCELFFSLLGWEGALEVWYHAFPHVVLTQLSGNPQAVEACLGLGESSQLSAQRPS